MFAELQTFFETYSLSDIILFSILLVSALLGAGRVVDEISARIRRVSDREARKNAKEKELNDRLQLIEDRQGRGEDAVEKLQQTMDFFSDKVEILIDSDKDSIKAYLTDKHHYYYFSQGWIDDYNLDCVERRYVHYKKAGGNSFVDHLMEELRSLPTQPPATPGV